MISVSRLVKRYGSRVAVNGVSFDVAEGDIVGFLGPNGAGKSTTLRILAGFLGRTSGTVTVAGFDIAEQTIEAQKKIGYMPEAVPLYPEMRVAEYLGFRAELKGVPRARRRGAVDAAMTKANVADVATVLIGKLSKGYKQRVGLADALVANPPLLILDEPTAGLDPNQIREVRQVIRDLGRDHTVLLSTHILSEVEASCTRAIVIAKGELVAQGTLDEVRRKRRAGAHDVTVRGDADAAARLLGAIDGVARAERVDVAGAPDVVTIRCTWGKTAAEADVGAAIERAVAALVGAGIAVREVRPVGSSLEDVFAELTRAPGTTEAA